MNEEGLEFMRLLGIKSLFGFLGVRIAFSIDPLLGFAFLGGLSYSVLRTEHEARNRIKNKKKKAIDKIYDLIKKDDENKKIQNEMKLNYSFLERDLLNGRRILEENLKDLPSYELNKINEIRIYKTSNSFLGKRNKEDLVVEVYQND